MELERINQKPEFRHSLTEQELTDMLSVPDGARKAALAKDWSIINQKLDWLIERTIKTNNTLVEHDRIYQFLKAVATLVCAGGGLLAILKILQGFGVL